MTSLQPRSVVALALALALALAGLFGSSELARACDCGGGTIEEAFQLADVVFVGRVVSVELRGQESAINLLETEVVWKGPVAARYHVESGRFSDICGYRMDEGERHLIFATIPFTEAECEHPWLFLETHDCTRNQPVSETVPLVEMPFEPIWTHPGTGPFATGQRFLRGDVDENGIVNMTDSIRLLDHLFRGRQLRHCEDALDVNDDSRVDVTDPVFGLNFLFLGGPEPPAPGTKVPGFDETPDDPFVCGDRSTFECGGRSDSNLPGVHIELVEAPCRLTLAEASAGVHFVYQLVVEESHANVISRQLGTCQQPGPGGMMLFPTIEGRDSQGQDQRYCLCDLGKCFHEDHEADLEPGTSLEVFRWCGKNWFGPSDFGNPIGPAFPSGTYTFRVRGEGVWTDAEGVERRFTVSAEYDFELVR